MIQLSMELEKIKEYIDILDEREKEVIVKRFGLGLDMRRRNERLRKAGYVSRIEKRALMKMFHEFKSREREKRIMYISSCILKWAAFLLEIRKEKSCVQKKSMFTVENDGFYL